MDLLNFVKLMENFDKSITTTNFDTLMDSFYESISNSIVNSIRKDDGNYDDLNNIKNIKKDITKASRKQYKVIISYCEKEKVPDIKIALKKYDFLHFLKLIIRILDIDEEYNIKVEQCKQYFGNPEIFELYKYLHDHTEVSSKELKNFIGIDNNIFNFALLKSDDLIRSREEGSSVLYSLSPKAKNLYAFYVMKNVNINDMISNYNEAKVNEVLEYLIEYILNQPKKKHKKIKRPKLNSSSANYNLNIVTNLLNQKASYSNDYFQFFDKNNDAIDMLDGGRPWKINY